ncbi:group 1 family glycosyl transferase [Burkholderia pseudomultivorans]|uniref:Group 1 family glycosyl transferase n=2 Tax=Burkholderia pseudomultivorans TaxID=1207504 RepID=A0A6P2KF44_9BURK|nr:group 1 family glycosyl transferase [Burkholderia pseudomultivorans]
MRSGGAERVASTLANAWAQYGHSVTIIATYSGGGECFYSLDYSIRLIYLAETSRIARSKLTGYFVRLRALRKLICDIGPDVVISFLTNVNVSTIAATVGLRVPIIACEHNNPLSDGRSPLWRWLVRLTYPQANLITLLTESVVDRFRKNIPGVKRIAVMPNPLPNDLLAMPLVTHAEKKTRQIIAVGRLHAQKQFDHLISVFGLLARDFPDWNLSIWGDGPLRASLGAQIQAAGLNERVSLPGLSTQLWQEMTKADIFVLSSRFEGMPMVMMESMALGLPVAAYDCPSGPRELTQDGKCGLLVPSGDIDRLAVALRQLMSDATLRQDLGRKAADAMRSNFSISIIMKKWDDLFEGIGVKIR